jgi:hypothetical protein
MRSARSHAGLPADRLNKNRIPAHSAVRTLTSRELATESRPGAPPGVFEHDFSKTPGPALAQRRIHNRPCAISPARCPFGGACHNCPLPVQTKIGTGNRRPAAAGRVATIRRTPT